jgi:hypothetical protein
MTTPRAGASPSPPSAKKLAFATGAALAVAALVLVTAVLPAEFGIDPLGTGKALGLLDLYATGEEVPAPHSAPPMPG